MQAFDMSARTGVTSPGDRAFEPESVPAGER